MELQMALRFSQRAGKTPIRNVLQAEEMDDVLRAGIWNCFQIAFVEDGDYIQKDIGLAFFRRMWHNFFKRPIDTLERTYPSHNLKDVREWFFKTKWHEVYDFVEYLAQGPEDDTNARYRQHLGHPSSFANMCNDILEREVSAYRLVKGQVMPITEEAEIEAIESALFQKGPWSTCAEHIRRSAALLFDRGKPNYPNAVKEAISAVESACCVVTGNSKATLGQALKEIEKSHPLHAAFKEAFSKLYGYTSDAGGIRHGSIVLADVTFEEAKYMLVACSAFVNYLKGISAKGA